MNSVTVGVNTVFNLGLDWHNRSRLSKRIYLSHSNNNHQTGVVNATRRRSHLLSPIISLTEGYEGKYWVIVNTAVSLQSSDAQTCTYVHILSIYPVFNIQPLPVSSSPLWFSLWCDDISVLLQTCVWVFPLAAGRPTAAYYYLIWSSGVSWSSLSPEVVPVWHLENDSQKCFV